MAHSMTRRTIILATLAAVTTTPKERLPIPPVPPKNKEQPRKAVA